MNELRIAAIGLPQQDSLILQSTLGLLNTAARRWIFVAANDAPDVLLVHDRHQVGAGLPTPQVWAQGRPPPLIVTVAHSGAPKPTDGLGLALPLRARELAAPLEALGLRLMHPVRPQVRESRVIRPTDLVEMLTRRAEEFVGRLPATLLFGVNGALTIEQLGDGPLPASLCWCSTKSGELQALCNSVRARDALRLAFNVPAASVPEADLSFGSVSQLVWALAAYEPQPQTRQPADARFRLQGWPDFGALPALSSHSRIVALLNRRSFTMTEASLAAGVAVDDVVAVINACDELGLLRVDASASPLSRAPTLFGAPSIAGQRRLGGLMLSIRAALRGAVARRSS